VLSQGLRKPRWSLDLHPAACTAETVRYLGPRMIVVRFLEGIMRQARQSQRRVGIGAATTAGLASALIAFGALAPASAEPVTDPGATTAGASAEPTSVPTAATTDDADTSASPAPVVDVPSASASAAVGAPAGSQAVVAAPHRDVVIKTVAQLLAGKAKLVRGDTGPAVDAVQARLNVAGIKTPITGTYTRETEKAVEHLQWKYLLDESGEVNKNTYRKLVSITSGRFVLPKACRARKTKLIICVDLKQRVLRYVQRGTVTTVIDIRSGRPGAATRKGMWRVYAKQVHLISTLYHTPMPYSMFFSGGQALHYSMYFDADGYNGASHGCLNIGSLRQAKWLYGHTPKGTGVLVY